MRATRDKDRLTVSLNALESRVLGPVLQAIIANYKVPPEKIDPKVAAVWYSTRGCETAQMSPEETRDWLQQLHGFKSAQLCALEDWSRQLAASKGARHELQIKVEQAAGLLTVLNDHRLMAAAQHDIGEREMDLPTLAAFRRLGPARQSALFEVHFLASLIQEILHVIAPEAANWML
jgi:hypothetical protein